MVASTAPGGAWDATQGTCLLPTGSVFCAATYSWRTAEEFGMRLVHFELDPAGNTFEDVSHPGFDWRYPSRDLPSSLYGTKLQLLPDGNVLVQTEIEPLRRALRWRRWCRRCGAPTRRACRAAERSRASLCDEVGIGVYAACVGPGASRAIVWPRSDAVP